MKSFLPVLFITLLFSTNNVLNAQSVCADSLYGSHKNIGLYGGYITDLTYSYQNKRLFATVESPASLFYSDDTANTWKPAYVYDSLKYECGDRGWGGGAYKVIANSHNWVASMNKNVSTSSCVVSFNGGDSATWQTAVDPYLLNQQGLTKGGVVNDIAISDSFLYVGVGSYLIKIDQSGYDPLTDVTDVGFKIVNANSNSKIIGIAATNNTSGFPICVIVDTTGFGSTEGLLYKYNGSTFSAITLPIALNFVQKVFTIFNQTTGDTLFITGKDNSNTSKMYRTFDGGLNWIDISNTNDSLLDVDYSPLWLNYAQSGTILFAQENQFSPNLGTTWLQYNDGSSHYGCVHPVDTNTWISNSPLGVVKSNKGPMNIFNVASNINLEAIDINHIAKTLSHATTYAATQSGLAYTSAYNNSIIDPYQRWRVPYGKFPISPIEKRTMTSVAIDASDSLHVVTTSEHEIFYSFFGPDSFKLAQFNFSFNTAEFFTDIAFVTPSIVLAVTKKRSDNANQNCNVYKSTDAGATWNIESVPDFENGNTIAVNYDNNDTAIYIGTGSIELFSDTGYLWKSTDLGANWNKFIGPTQSVSPFNKGLAIQDIVIDPRGNDTIYMVTEDLNDIVKSYDGGNTYIYKNVSSGNGVSGSVAINKIYPDSVYFGLGNKLIVYNNPLDSARILYWGIPGETLNDLSIGSVLVGSTTGFYVINLDPVIDMTGINENKTDENKNIIGYPNPSSGEIIFCINNVENNNATLYINDIFGNELSKSEVKIVEGKLICDLNSLHLSNGTYLVSIKQNKNIYRFKMMVIK